MSTENTELQNDEQVECRICLQNGDKTTMLAPCACTGSAAYIHTECLGKECVRLLQHEQDPTICSICKTKFKYVDHERLSAIVQGQYLRYTKWFVDGKIGVKLLTGTGNQLQTPLISENPYIASMNHIGLMGVLSLVAASSFLLMLFCRIFRFLTGSVPHSLMYSAKYLWKSAIGIIDLF